MNGLLERFFRYSAIDTCIKTSDNGEKCSAGQQQFAQVIQQELIQLGLKDTIMTIDGCIKACLPANTHQPVPAIAFVAHLDSPECVVGCGQCRQIDYQGQQILPTQQQDCILSTNYIDKAELKTPTLIVGDGRFILGAANKAAIAQLLTFIAQLQQQQLTHGDIHLLFIANHTSFNTLPIKKLFDFETNYIFALENSGSCQWSTLR